MDGDRGGCWPVFVLGALAWALVAVLIWVGVAVSRAIRAMF